MAVFSLARLGDLLSPDNFEVSVVEGGKIEELKETQKDHKQIVPLSIDKAGVVIVRLSPKTSSNTMNQAWFRGDFKSSCDYLLFVPRKDGGVDVVLCELKRAIDGTDGTDVQKASRQVFCTMPIAMYVLEGLRVHFGEARALVFQPEFHYVAIYNGFKGAGKQRVFVDGAVRRENYPYKEEVQVKLLPNFGGLKVSDLLSATE